MTKRRPHAPKTITRRDALKTMSAASAAAMWPAAGCGPGADGEPPARVPLDEAIDTVVVIMMENRSFDHTYGGLTVDEGRTDLDGLRADMSNPLNDGTPVFPAPVTTLCAKDPAHGWNPSHRQWGEGANDGFVAVHENRYGLDVAPEAMSYLTRTEQPTTYALAEQGAICQRWFSSVMGPTWPNRYYAGCATSMGNKSNDAIVDEIPTHFERVWRSKRPFANYYGNFPFFALNARLRLSDPEFQYLEQFYVDAAEGNLPPFVWIDPVYGRNDDHPPAHPLAGQVLIQSIYQALVDSPHWERCLFIVTYDEHGGYFDHVSPPTTADERAGDGFDQLGFRVPTFMASPWIKPGTVDDTVYDHTSIYASLASLWELEPLTARDAAANTFWDVIDRDAIDRGEPYPPVTLAPIEASDDEIYAPECLALTDVVPTFSAGGPGPGGLTGQPELEQFAAAHYAGHEKNRIAQTDAVYRRLLEIAEAQGVLVRKG